MSVPLSACFSASEPLILRRATAAVRSEETVAAAKLSPVEMVRSNLTPCWKFIEYLLHHGLSSLLIENAPQRLGIHSLHRVHHGSVIEQAGRVSIAGIKSPIHRISAAEDHGGRIDKAKDHAGLGQWIDSIRPHQSGLDLILAEVGQNVLGGKLTLRDT